MRKNLDKQRCRKQTHTLVKGDRAQEWKRRTSWREHRVSVWRDVEARARTHTNTKDETKMMNMQIFLFTFFYFVFCRIFRSHLCRKKVANAINGRRLTPCRHLSTSAQLCSWEMKLFSIFWINFLSRRVCDSRQMGTRTANTTHAQQY